MQLDLLDAFVKVAELGSMTDAAPSLGCSAPAVSQKMSRLEQQLGVVLLLRTPTGVEPTPAGELLLRRARRLLGMAADLRSEVTEVAGIAEQSLRISSFSSANVNLLPAVIRQFQQSLPDATLSLTEMDYSDPCGDVLLGNVDLAVAFRYDHVPIDVPEGITVRSLGHERLMAVLPVRHRLAKKSAVSFEDLREEPWVFFPNDNVARTSVEAETVLHDFEPDVVFETRDYQVIHVLVGNGLGVSLLPAMMQPEFDAKTTTAIPLKGTNIGRELLLIVRSEYQSNATSLFCDLLLAGQGREVTQA